MYEITVIETAPSGDMQMAHIPCNDEDLESVALGIIRDEDICVARGIVRCYTTITHYFPNRDAYKHYAPQHNTMIHQEDK